MLDHLTGIWQPLKTATGRPVYLGWPNTGPNSVPAGAAPPYQMLEPLAETEGTEYWEILAVFRLHTWARSYSEAEQLASKGFVLLHGLTAQEGAMLAGRYARRGRDVTVEDAENTVHVAETFEVLAGDRRWMEAQFA